jgi:UPF0042 nucleotide-binding protein
MIPTRVIFWRRATRLCCAGDGGRILSVPFPVKARDGGETALRSLRALADMVIDTEVHVHELRAHLTDRFKQQTFSTPSLVRELWLQARCAGRRGSGFDVRFLPNPHFVSEFRPLTGRHPRVAKYIRSFPQTQEFISRISNLLVYLLPHYIREGKSYLTDSFGCTGGQHRSVMIAEEVGKRLRKAAYKVKVTHRDMPK